VGAAVAGIAGVALIVVVALAAGGDPAFTLPDAIGEEARVEEGPFDVFIDAMIEDLAEANVEIDGASYGSRLDPRYILIVSELEGFPAGDVLVQMKTTYDSPGDEILLDRLVERDTGGIHYECAPTSDVTIPTTVCAWVGDRTVGMLISLVSDDPDEGIELLREAREETEA
jgi:hypothetical protein